MGAGSSAGTMGAGSSGTLAALPTSVDKATARQWAGDRWDEAAFDSAAKDGAVPREVLLRAGGVAPGPTSGPTAFEKEWLRSIACADLFLDELEDAAAHAPGADVARRFTTMLKSGMLEIEEEDDDDDTIIRDITLPSMPAIRVLLAGAVDAVQEAAAVGSPIEKALAPLRDELLMASHPAPAPPTMAAKALVLSELAAGSIGDGDALALRNAYGERLAPEDKQCLVDRTTQAGISPDGQSSLVRAWALQDVDTPEEGASSSATSAGAGAPALLMDGILGLSTSDQQVVSAVVDGAAYEAVVAEQLGLRDGGGGAPTSKRGQRGGAQSLL